MIAKVTYTDFHPKDVWEQCVSILRLMSGPQLHTTSH